MKILIATSLSHLAGGSESFCREVYLGLKAQGHSLRLVSDYPVPSNGKSIVENSDFLGAAFTSGATELLDKAHQWEPDLVFGQPLESSSGLHPRVATLAPSIFIFHDYFGTCISSYRSFSKPIPKDCTKPLSPSCFLHYYPRRCGGLSPVTMVRNYIDQKRNLQFLRSYRAVAYFSELAKEILAANKVTNTHFVPNSNVRQATTTLPPAPPMETVRLIAVCRLVRQKGVHVLLDAIPKLERKLGSIVKLDVLGDGRQLQPLKEQARQLGIETKVHFHGWVDEPTRTSLYQKAHLHLMPSLWAEPFGLVGYEAGQQGVPTIAFKLGGIPTWLKDDVSGHLVEVTSDLSTSFANTIEFALRDRAHFQKLRQGAFEIANQASINKTLAALMRIADNLGIRRQAA